MILTVAVTGSGRLREVPGIGPSTEAKIRDALERPRTSPRRGLLLNRARQLVGGIADALGGETAGDPRRWRDSSEHLAVVVTSERPDGVIIASIFITCIIALSALSRYLRAMELRVESVAFADSDSEQLWEPLCCKKVTRSQSTGTPSC